MPRIMVTGLGGVLLASAVYFAASALTWAHGPSQPAPIARTAPADAVGQTLAGVVEIVTVEDALAPAAMRHYVLRSGVDRPVMLAGEGLVDLVNGSRIEVEGLRDGSVLYVSHIQVLSGFVTPSVASDSVAGKLRLFHADYFDASRSEFILEVARDDGSAVVLDLPLPLRGLQAGMRVVASGALGPDGSSLRPSVIVVTAPADATEFRVKVGADAVTNKVLVVLMRYQDSPANPFTQAQVQTVFAGGAGTGSVAEFYKETSFGQQLLTTTITVWMQAALNTPAGCAYSTIMTDGNNLAAAAGYTIANYNNVVYVFPRIAGCGWAGLAYIGWGRALINGYNTTSVYGHELGHNFGLLHAGSLTCPNQNIVGGSCTIAEYGDPFDTMGNQSAMHFNAAQKNYLGWIADSTVSTQAAGSGTWRISPLETAGASSYAVTMSTRRTRTYWLEYRQPIGFDAGLSSRPNNGAQVRLSAPFEWACSGCADTTLLDMVPSTSTFNDATLVAGKNFRDPTTGVSVSVLGSTATALDLLVQMAGQPIVADFNGDNKSDLLWRNPATGETVVWLMTGGTVTTGAMLIKSYPWQATHVGDFNGDGKSDIVWRNVTTGETAIWLMDGTNMIAGGQVMPLASWIVTHVADFNGDGKMDLVWRNLATGETVIWLMNGMSIAGGFSIMPDPRWVLAYTGDFNGDQKADVVWRNVATGQTAMWLMNGASIVAGAAIMSDPKWMVTHVADFDGNGKSDLVWRNTNTGATAIWTMNGLQIVAGGGLQTNADAHVTHVADFNGDGKADLIWRNTYNGQTSAWLMNGVAAIGAAQLIADSNYSVTRTGDFDGNAKADIVWRNSSTGTSVMWLMNGALPAAGSTLSSDANWHVQP